MRAHTALLAAFLTATTPHAPAEMARPPLVVHGIVRAAGTTQPLADAIVTADGHKEVAKTNAAGRYELRLTLAAESTSVTIRVRCVGYTPGVVTAVIAGDSASADVALQPSAAMLSEVVTTASGYTEQRQLLGASVAANGAIRIRSAGSVAVVAGAPGAPGRRADSISSNTEEYSRIDDNPFLSVAGNPLSTFSVDVDRASYANVRRFVTGGELPPKDAVRIEELINYFPYAYTPPQGSDPVSITTDLIEAPWNRTHRLVRVALRTRPIETEKLPPNNLVFLIDVSGSMNEPTKLPLVKQALALLVDQLRPQDRVAIVVYAGNAGLVLPSTSGTEKPSIIDAINRLEAGGSTAGGAGIRLAYDVAKQNFLKEGNNRVVLATDGDFNVGVSSTAELTRLIEERRNEGTYLTVLGFGMGNYKDGRMEQLADKGNGNYAYVDDISEARKTLVKELGATLVTVAKDVKLQVEFNPTTVQAYRLIGYENRLLRTEDFADDRKDAGDMGAGHAVTALYELIPAGVKADVDIKSAPDLRYQTKPATTTARVGKELVFVKLRYKPPTDSTSRLMERAVPNVLTVADDDFRFAAAVAGYGMLLRESPYKGRLGYEDVLTLARGARGSDVDGYRAGFLSLVEATQSIATKRVSKKE